MVLRNDSLKMELIEFSNFRPCLFHTALYNHKWISTIIFSSVRYCIGSHVKHNRLEGMSLSSNRSNKSGPDSLRTSME